MHLFNFSPCTFTTLSLVFFCIESSCSRFCSIATKWKGLSPVAVSFKLRKFKCKIAKRKKMKVKLLADKNIKYNRNFYCLGMIHRMFERYRTSAKVWMTSWKSCVKLITIIMSRDLGFCPLVFIPSTITLITFTIGMKKIATRKAA